MIPTTNNAVHFDIAQIDITQIDISRSNQSITGTHMLLLALSDTEKHCNIITMKITLKQWKL